MRAYLGFLCIPAAVGAAMLGVRWAPGATVTVPLPIVQPLKVPQALDALPLVTRREPALVDLTPLMPVDPPVTLVKVPPPARAAEPVVISAILVDGDKRITQIGTDLYQQGDSFGVYRVERIEPMRVLLVNKGRSGERLWVEMNKGF